MLAEGAVIRGSVQAAIKKLGGTYQHMRGALCNELTAFCSSGSVLRRLL